MREPLKEMIFAQTKKQLRDSLEILKKEKVIGADTETNGLIPTIEPMWSIQLSTENGDFGVLIPFNYYLDSKMKPKDCEEIRMIKELFSNEDITFIFHNAKFDLKFLSANNIEVANSYCSAVTAKMLNAGTFRGNGLKDELKFRFGVTLSKEVRKDFYNGVFKEKHLSDPKSCWTPELIDYAMDDVFYLGRLMKAQLTDVKVHQLMDTLALEADVLYCLAKSETIGVGIDVEGCKEFHQEMTIKRDSLEDLILKELEPEWQKYWRPIYQKDIARYDRWKVQYDLVKAQTNKMKDGRKLSAEAVALREKIKGKAPFKNGVRPKEKERLKIRSSVPLKNTLEQMGIFIPDSKKETLEQIRIEYPIIESILEYKKYAKLSEFGELFNHINPFTGRIHCNYNQIVSTGRMSCSDPNLQQIPTRSAEGKRFRKLFQSRKGYKFVGADFAGIELVILAVLSGQNNLLEIINKGADPHSFTISQLLGCPYDLIYEAKENKKILDIEKLTAVRKAFQADFDLPMLVEKGWSEPQMIEWVNALRDCFKTISYGVVYGLSEYGLSRKFHCTPESARALINDGFLMIYPEIGNFTKTTGERGYREGFSKTIGGRKRFFRKPKMKTDFEIIKDLKLSILKEGKNLSSFAPYEYEEMIEMAIRNHKKEIQSQIMAIKREAGNMPIQGTSADITKLALVLFDGYLMEHNFPDDEGIILIVHDEFASEIKDERAELASLLMARAMKESAGYYLGKDVLIKVEPYIETFWKH